MTRTVVKREYNIPLLSAMALALVCIIVMVVSVLLTISHVDSQAETTAHDLLKTNFAKMEADFSIAQSAARAAAWYASNVGDCDKEKIREISHQLLLTEKHIAGCGIMTTPERGGYVYSYRDTLKHDVLYDTESSEILTVDYTSREYYRMMTEGTEGWTQPYETDAVSQYQCSMATYIIPLSKDTANMRALCVDVSLDWIQDFITKELPYEGAISALYDQEGNVILQSAKDDYGDDTSMMAYEVDTSEPGTYEMAGNHYIAIVEHLSNGWRSALLIPGMSLYNYLFRVLCIVFAVMVVAYLVFFFRIIMKSRSGHVNITGFIAFFISSLVILTADALYSIRKMNNMSEDFAMQVMKGALAQIDSQLKMVEDVGQSSEWYLKYILGNDEMTYSWAHQIISINDNIEICGLAYAADYGRGAHFPCAIKNAADGKLKNKDVAANSDFYFKREYYQQARSGKSGWTKPYSSALGNDYKGHVMTYYTPVIVGGKFCALLDLDINLGKIHEKVARNIPYEDAITATFDEDNNIVSSSMRNSEESISNEEIEERNQIEHMLTDQLRKKIADKTTLRYGSTKYLAFTAKLPNGYTGALMVKQSDVHHENHTYLAGIGLFTLFIFFIIYLYLLPRIRRRE